MEGGVRARQAHGSDPQVHTESMLDFIQGASFFVFAYIASRPDMKRFWYHPKNPRHTGWSRMRLLLYMYIPFSFLIEIIQAIF